MRSTPHVPELIAPDQPEELELPPLAQLEESYAQTDEGRPLLTLVQLRRREHELENEVAQLKQQLLFVNVKSKDLYNKMNKKLQNMIEVHDYQFEQMRLRYEKELKEGTQRAHEEPRAQHCRRKHLPYRVRCMLALLLRMCPRPYCQCYLHSSTLQGL